MEGHLSSLTKDELLQSLENTHPVLKYLVESPKNVVIFALDTDYRYIAFNENHRQTMREIWGVDIEIGVNMLNYINDSKDRMKAKENFNRALSGESFTIEEEYGDAGMERRYYENYYNPVVNDKNEVLGLSLYLRDITDRKKLEYEREQLIQELRESLKKVKTLSGLLPICSNCKKIRDDAGYWNQIEEYIRDISDVQITHSICPECAEKLYPKYYKKTENR